MAWIVVFITGDTTIDFNMEDASEFWGRDKRGQSVFRAGWFLKKTKKKTGNERDTRGAGLSMLEEHGGGIKEG